MLLIARLLFWNDIVCYLHDSYSGMTLYCFVMFSIGMTPFLIAVLVGIKLLLYLFIVVHLGMTLIIVATFSLMINISYYRWCAYHLGPHIWHICS